MEIDLTVCKYTHKTRGIQSMILYIVEFLQMLNF